MARIKNFMQITGSLADVSMYTMTGHDEVIVRTKGGPTKRQIKTKPQFDRVRKNNSEWSGCTKMSHNIRESFFPLKRLEDYPVMGTINAISKQIQKLDTENEHGKRSVLLSKYKQMISGLPLTRKQALESVLKVPVETSFDRTLGIAAINIPPIHTGLYLHNHLQLPYFRIVACLGGACDMVYKEDLRRYESNECTYIQKDDGLFESKWMSTSGMHPGMNIRLKYPLEEKPIPDEVTVVLCMGVEFGKPNGDKDTIEPVKYTGSGKVMRVG